MKLQANLIVALIMLAGVFWLGRYYEDSLHPAAAPLSSSSLGLGRYFEPAQGKVVEIDDKQVTVAKFGMYNQVETFPITNCIRKNEAIAKSDSVCLIVGNLRLIESEGRSELIDEVKTLICWALNSDVPGLGTSQPSGERAAVFLWKSPGIADTISPAILNRFKRN